MALDPRTIVVNTAGWDERTGPDHPVSVAPRPAPVVVRVRWADGGEDQVEAVAKAWSDRAVEVSFSAHGRRYQGLWFRADDVRRTTAAPRLLHDADA